MKFGTGSDAVNAISFQIERGQLSASKAHPDRIKILSKVDKSKTVINFGARKKRVSTFKLVQIANDDYVTLVNYLNTNTGLKVQIEEEFANEKLFTQAVINETPDTYFAYITDFDPHGEQDFSNSRRLFDVSVTLEFAGANSTSEINTADSQSLDILVEIDTTLAKTKGFVQSSQPTATFTGQRWLDTDDNKLYKWNGSSWLYMYTVAADDADYGFVDGVFYLSAFADISQSAPDNIDQDHICGLITAKGIQVQEKSMDLDDGPNTTRKTGFKVTLPNNSKLWKFFQDNGMSIHGAEGKLSFYKSDASPKVLLETIGFVNKPIFNYGEFILKFEQSRFNDTGEFPEEKINETDSRYIGMKAEQVGKTVFRSYGYFPPDRPGVLQNISSKKIEVPVTAYDTSTSPARDDTVISAAINRLGNTEILINKDNDNTILHYLFSSTVLNDITNSTDLFAITILNDGNSGSSNPGEVRKIISIDDEVSYSGFYTIVIDAAFSTDPDTNSSGVAPDTDQRVNIQIIQTSFKFQTGDAQSGGFGQLNNNDEFNRVIRIFALSESEKELDEIPASGWSTGLASPYYGNMVALNPRSALNPGSFETYQSSKNLNYFPFNINPSPILGDANRYIDYQAQLGFSLPAQYDQEHKMLDLDPWGASASINDTKIASPRKPISIYRYLNQVNENGIRPRFLSKLILASYLPIENNITYAGADRIIFGMKWSRNPNSEIESLFLNKTDVKLVLNMKIRSLLSSAIETPNSYIRNQPIGIKIVLRFKKTDNSYITGWEYDIEDNEMGLYVDGGNSQTTAELLINNNPNGTDVTNGFFDGATTLSKNWDHQIELRTDTYSTRNAQTSLLAAGDKIWVDDNGLGVAEMQQWDGSTFSIINVNVGEIVYYYPNVYKIVSGPLLDPAVDGVDFNSLPVLSGRNLFDISALFGGSPQWSSVKEMELLFLTKDHSQHQYADYAYGFRKSLEIWFYDRPHIFWGENTASTDRQLFASFRGKNLPETPGTAYTATPFAIVKDIMDDMYPNQWDESSLTTVTSSPNRQDWVWRKQFKTGRRKEDVLKEICRNLWASAIIDENDKIKFVSMFPTDHAQGSPAVTYTDSDIIEDSWSNVEYRGSDEIYQEFYFGYNYNPVSEFSPAIPAYDELKYGPDDGPVEIKTMAKQSENINNRLNTYRENFEYHYDLENGGFRILAAAVCKHKFFNAWRFKIMVPITELWDTGIRQMNYISVNSYFHTDNIVVEGWIENYLPIIYEGLLEIRLLCLSPPGVLGPLCDPFNDALIAGIRDISGWTGANGKINDAGTASRSPVAVQKDAGTSPRTISC